MSIRLDEKRPIAKGVWGKKDVFVNYYFIQDGQSGEWFLVDAGMKWSAARILSMAKGLFGEGSRPAGIILTHGHFDHVGALKSLLTHWKVPVYVHALEIPYLTPASTSANGQQTPPQWNFKPLETRVSLRVRSIPGTDKINLAIKATQTEAQDKPAPDAPPGTLAYDVNTSLVVSNGDSAALGGMISERRLISVGRDPSNTTAADSSGNDITLFKFSRFHEFTDQKNQMIIFVTPTKIRNASEGTESLKRKFRLKK